MRLRKLTFVSRLLLSAVLLVPFVSAQKSGNGNLFAGAPASARNQKNPFNSPADISAGRRLYQSNCLACHGKTLNGTGNIPSLKKGDVPSTPDGAVFWFVTKGDVENGMPAWGDVLPAKQRWQIISYVKSIVSAPAATKSETASAAKAGAGVANAEAKPIATAPTEEASMAGALSDPLPRAPFLDFRLEGPGKIHKLTLADLPEPYETKSATNGPRIVARPKDSWPKALPGFKVELFADNLNNPRLLRTAPNGDIFLAESEPGDIKVFRGITSDGKPQQVETFATGLNQPFGIAFYPPGPNPQYVYVGNTDSVVRFPYRSGDLKASSPPEKLADLPPRGHWTRTLEFSADGSKLYVSVGSRSNVDDPDENSAEKDRAVVREYNPDGTGMRVYAAGIRNCVGLAREPKTNLLWCSTNERDGLGDNLVPDYISHIEDGSFFGWPWWYMGGHQDPRHKGKHPELKDKVTTPDVILQPHNASLSITFYNGKQFPAEYAGDLFAAEHGSWNKSIRVGYEVIRVPLHGTGKATGEYEDFLTGFVLPNGQVWGRPVGVTVAPDGSLLVSDDGSNSIWRVSYQK